MKINKLNDFVLNTELFCNPLSYDVMFPVLKNDPEYKGVKFSQIGEFLRFYSVNFR